MSVGLQVLWYKVNWLIGAINLIPWYLTYSTSTPPPLVAPPPPPLPSGSGCTNTPPDNTYTCVQQVKAWHAQQCMPLVTFEEYSHASQFLPKQKL